MPTPQTLPKIDEAGEHIDYLEEDTEHPTQRYALFSFLSPENVIKQKAEFYFERFIEWQDYEWKVRGLEKFMDFLSKKYTLKVDDLMKDAQEFAQVHNAEIKKTDVPEQYQVFLLKNEKAIQEQFDKAVDFRTNVRGVKLRRVFANLEEAQVFAKVLQRKYPKDNLFLGKVGAWLPWDPTEHTMPEVEYAERELNELMRKYKENEVNKEMFFAEQRDEKVKAQKEENERRRLENAKEKALLENVHPAEGGSRE